VRIHLGVVPPVPPDEVTFAIDRDGGVRLLRHPQTSIASLRGIAGTLKRPLEWDAMEQIAHDDYVIAEYGEDK
jgi:hypothetical protein